MSNEKTKALAPKDQIGAMLMRSLSSPEMRAALPKHVTPERMLRLTMSALSRNPDLLECTPISVVGAVVQASQIGLEIDPVLGHAHLIPFRNERTGVKEAIFIAGARGLIQLAYRSDRVERIDAECVFKGEDFRYAKGTHEELHHVPSLTVPHKKGDLLCVYALCWMKDAARPLFEVMSAQEVEIIRLRSPGKNSKAWGGSDEDYFEMAKKTVVRRAYKKWPVGVEAQRAALTEEQRDAGVVGMAASDFVRETEVEAHQNGEEKPKKPSKLDALKETLPPAESKPAETSEQEAERLFQTPEPAAPTPEPPPAPKADPTSVEAFDKTLKRCVALAREKGIGKGSSAFVGLCAWSKDKVPGFDLIGAKTAILVDETATTEQVSEAVGALMRLEDLLHKAKT